MYCENLHLSLSSFPSSLPFPSVPPFLPPSLIPPSHFPPFPPFLPPSPSTGLYLDAQAGLDFLRSRQDIDQRKIIVFGRSLGGAVAIRLTASLSHMDQ